MRVGSPLRNTESVDVFRRRLLLEELPLRERQPRPAAPQHSRGLRVLVDGFLHGSLLTLAVCTPKRRSLFSGDDARRGERFRTFLVSRPTTEPTFEEPAREAMPAPR